MVRWRKALVVCLALAGVLFTSFASAATAPAPTQPSTAPTAPTGTKLYQDLPVTHWAYADVLKLNQAGVLKVDKTGLFRPDQPVTRAELFKMVLAARRMDAGTRCLGLFTDVPCWAWYAPVVETAYRMGIAEGKGSGKFMPDSPVSRQELFTVVERSLGRRWEAANLADSTIDQQLAHFDDGGQIADWARPSVALALSGSITKGYDDGTFRPARLTTRAEAAAVVARILLSTDGLTAIQVDGRNVYFRQSLDLTASMFATGEDGVGTQTYTGLTVRPGTVAVDPNVIPLGHLLYVEGYGYAIAADIGGGIKGNRIDLYSPSMAEAEGFGIEHLRVWVLP